MNQGKLNTIIIDIDNPVAFKEQEFNMREINLITGMNGTGKSFLLVTSWVMNYLIANVTAHKLAKIPSNFIDMAQYTIDNSLNCKNTTGYIEGVFENCTIKIVLVKGKVISFDLNHEKIDEVQPAIYMSSYMRTFNVMDLYAKARNKLIKTMSHELVIQEMIKDYRLYDTVFMETLLMKLPVMITVDTNKHLKKFDFPDELHMLGIDEEGFYVILLKDDEKRYISKYYSAGHQSLINMTIANQK